MAASARLTDDLTQPIATIVTKDLPMSTDTELIVKYGTDLQLLGLL